MSELTCDPNGRYDVKLLLEQFSAGCRLCLLRNLAYEDAVGIILVDEERGLEFRQSYCHACYEHLRIIAINDLKCLVPFDLITKDPVIIQVPAYLVKKGDPLKVFFPEDPIDLGLLRQHRHEERENKEKKA